MHVLIIFFLAFCSLTAAGPYLDPTKPLNLYAFIPVAGGPGYYLNLAYLDKNRTTIGLRGYSVFRTPMFLPFPRAYSTTYNSTTETLTLVGKFNGQTVSNTETGYTDPMTFEVGNKNQGNLFLSSLYQPNQSPRRKQNELFYLLSNGDFKMCKSKVFDFYVLTLGRPFADNPFITRRCSQYLLQALPNGEYPPVY